MSAGNRVLYVINDAPFFLSHRLALAQAAQAEGYDVHVAAPLTPEASVISQKGLHFHPLPINRKGLYVWEEIRSIISLYRLYTSLRPGLVHHVTIKPVLYGGLMSRLTAVPAVVNGVTGLGFVFISRGPKGLFLRTVVSRLYRVALRHSNSRVVFQNPEDRDTFVRGGLVDPSSAVLIKGSGVDMMTFAPSPEKPGTPLVVLGGRLLWDKGVGEYVEAARHLRKAGVNARFVLVGESDRGNPAAVPRSKLEEWHRSGVVEWWGYHNDMPALIAESHVVCLPSYREGVPKFLIEGAACGRPIVATDVPGCREIVENENNGLLVPPRDWRALADALRRLIADPQLRERMGRRGRELAVSGFSLEKVVGETLALYRELLQNVGG